MTEDGGNPILPPANPIIRVPRPTYDKLTVIKRIREAAAGRSVTYGEVIEQLLERQP